MEELLDSDILVLIYKNSDTPTTTYLHYNVTYTNPDLTLATANIVKDASREIILDPVSGHRIIKLKGDFPRQAKEPINVDGNILYHDKDTANAFIKFYSSNQRLEIKS